MQRPPMDWVLAEATEGPHARIREGTRHVMAVRRGTPQLASSVATRVIETGNQGVFGYLRLADDRPVTCLCNFTETVQVVAPDVPEDAIDLLTGAPPAREGERIVLAPYQALWLRG
jgi:amylosucrase